MYRHHAIWLWVILQKFCAYFYHEEKIHATKTLIEQMLSDCLPKRQGGNKCRATIADMIKG